MLISWDWTLRFYATWQKYAVIYILNNKKLLLSSSNSYPFYEAQFTLNRGMVATLAWRQLIDFHCAFRLPLFFSIHSVAGCWSENMWAVKVNLKEEKTLQKNVLGKVQASSLEELYSSKAPSNRWIVWNNFPDFLGIHLSVYSWWNEDTHNTRQKLWGISAYSSR